MYKIHTCLGPNLAPKNAWLFHFESISCSTTGDQAAYSPMAQSPSRVKPNWTGKSTGNSLMA